MRSIRSQQGVTVHLTKRSGYASRQPLLDHALDRLIAGCVLGPLFALSPALAQTPGGDESPPTQAEGALTLPDLLEAARAGNSEIRAADARTESLGQRPIQERTLRDPMIGFRYHNEQLDRITFSQSEFTFWEVAAEQEIPFPGKLGLRGEIAEKEADRERAIRDATVLTVLSNVAVSYYELAAVDRSASILRESTRTLEMIVRQTEARYRLGTAAQQDVLRASLELGGIQERLTVLDREREAEEASLNALLGRSAGQPLPRTVVFHEPRPLEPLDDLLARLAQRSPALAAAQEEVSRSDASLALAKRQYFPDFTVAAAYANKGTLFPEWEVGVRMNIPLYFWRRQGPAVAENAYAKTAAEHGRENLRVDLEGKLREFHALAEASRRLVRLYDDTLIPQASLTLQSALASYEVGSVDFLTTLNAFTALLEYQIRGAQEKSNVGKALAEIGPLVGETPLGEPLQRH